jgi:hypothetical protein
MITNMKYIYVKTMHHEEHYKLSFSYIESG